MALVVEIKVVPSSGRQQWLIDKTGTLKCYLKNPPERGLANQELITLLSKALKIPRGEMSLLAGATSRKKIIKIKRDLSLKDLLGSLGIEVQQSFLFK